METFEVLNGGE